MKKFLSMLLATVFALTAFGAVTVFSGFIGAGAVEYEYYRYESLPGYSIFTDAELALMTNTYSKAGYNETIEGVGPVVTYEITKSGGWMTVYHGRARNLKASSNTEHKDFTDMTWAAIDTVGNKTFLGDMNSEGYALAAGFIGRPFMSRRSSGRISGPLSMVRPSPSNTLPSMSSDTPSSI